MSGNTAKDGTGTHYFTLLDSEGRTILVGPVAHDGAAAGGVLRIGGVYRSTVPAVSVNDIVDLLMDAAGRAHVLDGALQEFAVLASAERTATTNSADFTNPGAKGVILTVDVTAETDTPEITLSVTYKVPTLGAYETLFTAALAIDAVGTHTYIVYPGPLTASDDVVEVQDLPIPRTWRVTITHADADAMTYSVNGCYLL